jgi:AcrR family transcriptional regulator
MNNERNNEQLILEAAEMEFLEKGFKNAATTAIAKRAGVTHAMLHYYFRTKENLFQKVFQEKAVLLGNSFYQQLSGDLPFEDVIRKFIEFHFNFVRENPKLLIFVFNEAVVNKNNRHFLLEQMRPKVLNVLNRFEKLLSEEVAKGSIRPVKAFDLLVNIASLNVFTFVTLPVIEDLTPDSKDAGYLENLINERKENVVQFVLNALKAINN